MLQEIKTVKRGFLVSLDNVIEDFRKMGFEINSNDMSRTTNTNDFICDFKYAATDESLFLNGISVSKYIDLWPYSLQTIFMEIDNWKIRRFCPFIDLFENYLDENTRVSDIYNGDGQFSDAENATGVNLKFNQIKMDQLVESLPYMYGIDVSNTNLNIGYISKEVISLINQKLKGNGFINIIHASAMNEKIDPWIFIGLRFIISRDPATNIVHLINDEEL